MVRCQEQGDDEDNDDRGSVGGIICQWNGIHIVRAVWDHVSSLMLRQTDFLIILRRQLRQVLHYRLSILDRRPRSWGEGQELG